MGYRILNGIKYISQSYEEEASIPVNESGKVYENGEFIDSKIYEGTRNLNTDTFITVPDLITYENNELILRISQNNNEACSMAFDNLILKNDKTKICATIEYNGSEVTKKMDFPNVIGIYPFIQTYNLYGIYTGFQLGYNFGQLTENCDIAKSSGSENDHAKWEFIVENPSKGSTAKVIKIWAE